MPKSGILHARKFWRFRKSHLHITPAKATEISARGIELTDADLAMVIGGTEQTFNARAQVETGAGQPLGCCFEGMQTDATVHPFTTTHKVSFL